MGWPNVKLFLIFNFKMLLETVDRVYRCYKGT